MADNATKPVMTKRMAIVSGVVTVMVLAAVILLITAFGSPSRKSEEATKAEAATYIDQATSALESGDATLAAKFAAQAVALDPANKAAVAVAAKARRAQALGSGSSATGSDSGATGASSGSGSGTTGSETGSGSGTGSNQPVIDDSAFTKKVDDKGIFLPKEFAGFALGQPVVTDTEAQVSATPDAAGGARQVIWTVHEMSSAEKAKQFVEDTSKALYAEDAQTATIDSATVYIGTDGTRYATATYVRGIYVFEVLIAVDGQPASQLESAKKAAQAFGDSVK